MTEFNMWIRWHINEVDSGAINANIFFQPMLDELSGYANIEYGILIDTPADPETGVFETVEDAFDYYTEIAFSDIAGTLNLITGDTYTYGGKLIPCPPQVYNFVQPISDAAFTQSDWTQSDTDAVDFIKNKPSIPATFDDLTSGTTNKAYTNTEKLKLSGIQMGATVQVNSDWSASSGIAQILNKPSLATVATTGSYSDLTGSPTVPTAASGLTNDSSVTGSSVKDALNTLLAAQARTTSTLSLSLVGTGATGTQISATKDSSVRVNVSTSTTSTIGGAATSLVALKICSTNSGTEGNWTTVATLENDQTITLAIALQSIQVMKGQICADVPAGWYVKLVNSGTGTHSEAFVSGQQTIYG